MQAFTPEERARARRFAEQVIQTVAAVFQGELVVPSGHELVCDRGDECRWFLGGPGDSVSAYINRTPRDDHDPEQLCVEIRIFLDRPRAVLFVTHGSRYFGQHRDLIGSERFVSGCADYTELARHCVERVNQCVTAAGVAIARAERQASSGAESSGSLEAVNAELIRVLEAEIARLKRPAPCDCFDGIWVDCQCGNFDDRAEMERWRTDQETAARLQSALDTGTPPRARMVAGDSASGIA